MADKKVALQNDDDGGATKMGDGASVGAKKEIAVAAPTGGLTGAAVAADTSKALPISGAAAGTTKNTAPVVVRRTRTSNGGQQLSYSKAAHAGEIKDMETALGGALVADEKDGDVVHAYLNKGMAARYDSGNLIKKAK